MLFKLSNLNSNLALTLGYLNPALNNSALIIIVLNDRVVSLICPARTFVFPSLLTSSTYIIHFIYLSITIDKNLVIFIYYFRFI